MQEYWVMNHHVSLNINDAFGAKYQEVSMNHMKHLFEMDQLDLFTNFNESHCDIDIPMSRFMKLQPWYITIHDSCSCH